MPWGLLEFRSPLQMRSKLFDACEWCFKDRFSKRKYMNAWMQVWIIVLLTYCSYINDVNKLSHNQSFTVIRYQMTYLAIFLIFAQRCIWMRYIEISVSNIGHHACLELFDMRESNFNANITYCNACREFKDRSWDLSATS